VTVRRGENGTIILEGDCTVEEAEPLLQMLQDAPHPMLDWTTCSHLHTAVLQVVLAARPALFGPCGDPWVARWVQGVTMTPLVGPRAAVAAAWDYTTCGKKSYNGLPLPGVPGRS
jgi:hypothetical protein